MGLGNPHTPQANRHPFGCLFAGIGLQNRLKRLIQQQQFCHILGYRAGEVHTVRGLSGSELRQSRHLPVVIVVSQVGGEAVLLFAQPFEGNCHFVLLLLHLDGAKSCLPWR